MKTILIATTALALSMGAAHAFGGKGGNATAKAAQAQGQIQGQAQGQHQSVTVNEADIPRFTGSAVLAIQSLANDRCGRVALLVPYSAHTCNVIMEAEAIAALVEPVHGSKKAYAAAILHIASHDRTMRNTLVAAGLVKRK